jgi:hypothetical protein
VENSGRLSTAGLADALEASRARPSPDLAALVVPDLFAFAPELALERREAESTSGLWLRDEDGIVFGHAELARLQLPDEASLAKDAGGTVALIAGAPEAALAEATRTLLDTGRVTALSASLSTAIDADYALIPDALAGERDGAKIPTAAELIERASKTGVEVHRPGCVMVDDTRGAPRVALELLALSRRAKAQGKLDEDAPIGLVLYPRSLGVRATLTRKIAELFSGRLALYLLSSREDPLAGGRSKRPMAQNAPGISRRFRA